MMRGGERFAGQMAGKVVLLTGGGGGIGVEAGLAFVEMGATVLLAECDRERGLAAQRRLCDRRPGSGVFLPVDLADKGDVEVLCGEVAARFGCPDVLFHNATLAQMGAVEELPLDAWNRSYAVNLLAPVQLTRAFLPAIRERDSGVIAFVSSSGAAPHMGAYEVFKTAQAELGSTLAMELEETGIHAYTIGPGLVRTATAEAAIEIVAGRMGMSLPAFYRQNESHLLSAEAAGWGFALSALFAQRYRGQEIASIQVLGDCGLSPEGAPEPPAKAPVDGQAAALALQRVADTFFAQYRGWKGMNVFERQWVLRDFKKSVGLPADGAAETLRELLRAGPAALGAQRAFLQRLQGYWERQYTLLQGYERDPVRRAENSRIVQGWVEEVAALLALLS